jgi:prepilin-type N-terminal cleavage/methylation domain-containing protein
MIGLKNKKTNAGFTIVEVMTVIAVIGILVTITYFMIGDWRKRTAQSEVSSDLNSLVSAMESAKTFSNGYPSSIPSTFTSSKNVTVTLVSSTVTAYCAEATSTEVTSVTYHVTGSNKTPAEGDCT